MMTAVMIVKENVVEISKKSSVASVAVYVEIKLTKS